MYILSINNNYSNSNHNIFKAKKSTLPKTLKKQVQQLYLEGSLPQKIATEHNLTKYNIKKILSPINQTPSQTFLRERRLRIEEKIIAKVSYEKIAEEEGMKISSIERFAQGVEHGVYTNRINEINKFFAEGFSIEAISNRVKLLPETIKRILLMNKENEEKVMLDLKEAEIRRNNADIIKENFSKKELNEIKNITKENFSKKELNEIKNIIEENFSKKELNEIKNITKENLSKKEREKKIIELLKQGYTRESVAEFFNMALVTIRTIARKAGFTCKDGAITKKMATTNERNKRILENYKKGMSISEIANLEGVSTMTVRRALEKK